MTLSTPQENVAQILGIRRGSDIARSPTCTRSRLAVASLLAGIAALLSAGISGSLIHSNSAAIQTPSQALAVIIVPIVVSLATVLLAVVAMLRIAFSRGHRKGVGLASLSLVLGCGSLALFLCVLGKAIAHGMNSIG